MQFDRLGDGLSLAFGRDQKALADATARLSSGLRITTAADDPSGLAIAESLRSQALGLDQGQRNVQDGSNALTVADGALQTVQEILQRMRSLIVEGRSDLLSAGQRQDINVELHQLETEIDTIAGKTEFNGRKLLDGSLSSSPGSVGHAVTPAERRAGQRRAPDRSPHADGPAHGLPLDLKVTVDAYDPATNLVTVTIDAKSPDPAQTFSQAYPQLTTILAGQNDDNFWNLFPGPIPPNVDVREIDYARARPPDPLHPGPRHRGRRRQLSYVYTVPPTKAGGAGAPLLDRPRPQRGRRRAAQLARRLAERLGIAGVRVDPSDTITVGSEYRVDAAITTVGGNRAELGRADRRLERVGQRRRHPAGRRRRPRRARSADLNVAQATTQYTKLQIMTTMQTHLLRSVEDVTLNVYQLLTAGLH